MLKNPIYFFERKKNKISFQKAFFFLYCKTVGLLLPPSARVRERQTDRQTMGLAANLLQNCIMESKLKS